MWQTDDLQEWSAKMGIGRPTGIDLPLGEGAEGLVPSKKWTEEEIANGNEFIEPWGPGQNIQLAVGQGDLQTDPLQMAIAYAALGNGGTIVTPHLGLEVQDAAGRVLREIDPGPRRHVKINPESRRLIMEGLHDVTVGPGRDGDRSLREIPDPDRRQDRHRGTRAGHANQSWFISLAPYPNPNIVTVVTIEEGGFGAEAAAPGEPRDPRSVFPQHAEERETEDETKKPKAGRRREYEEEAVGIEGNSAKKCRSKAKKSVGKKPPKKQVSADDVRDAGAAGAARALRRPAHDRRTPRPRPHGLDARPSPRSG